MDDYALLCEECGYELDGLRTGAACPECGRAVERSRPENRAGTAWQRSPGLFSWVGTFYRTVRFPRDTFASLRIESRSSMAVLLALNLLASAAFIVAPWTGVFVGDPAREARRAPGALGLLTYGSWAAAQVLLGAVVLLVLTWIEWRGVRFFSQRRGWRLTKAGAWQVCAHASFGWLFCGVFGALSLALLFSMQRLFGIAPNGTLDLRPIARVRLDWVQILGVGGPVVGYLAGLMVFEMLIYHGVQACRFAATLPRPTPPAPDGAAIPQPQHDGPPAASTTTGR